MCLPWSIAACETRVQSATELTQHAENSRRPAFTGPITRCEDTRLKKRTNPTNACRRMKATDEQNLLRALRRRAGAVGVLVRGMAIATC
jgi:hypothetical protein